MAIVRFVNRDQWKDERLLQHMFPGWDLQGQESETQDEISPPLNVYEDAENFYARVELPGVKSEYVDVDVSAGVITLTAAVEPLPPERKLIHGEVRVGGYRRQFNLGRQVDASAIRAKLVDGVLTLTLPKAAGARERKIPIS